jgi:acyl-CoA reductase-like NAD-dependent aldehyde dehydrogenase
MKIVTNNPSTREVLGEFETTRSESLPEIFEKSKIAQNSWGKLSKKERCSALLRLKETLIDESDRIIDLIEKENGKPRFEAMTNEVQTCVDFLTYFAKKTPQILKNQSVQIINPFLRLRKSHIEYWPLGIVLIISPWNYPFLLPFADIVMALAAGNAVVHKPSEFTPSIGLEIQKLCEKAGLPKNIVQTVINDGSIGQALIQQRPAKIFFTGSAATGKKIIQMASEYLIPVNLELSGKDVMIIFSDADLEFATSAALWGGFSNSGQACASVERILIHRDVEQAFSKLLKEKISKLRPTGLREGELGAITSPRQLAIYEEQINDARQKNANFITGGSFNAEKNRLLPTLISSPHMKDLKVYQDESFGPIITISPFGTTEEAVKKANENPYGLAASIITPNLDFANEVAKLLEVGTVTINEVLYTAGIPGTPWGGVKDSGYGRTHSDHALYEFTNIRHVHQPRSRLFIFKSCWWFPYTEKQYAAFRSLFEINRTSWIKRLKGLPTFLSKFLEFLLKDKRL